MCVGFVPLYQFRGNRYIHVMRYTLGISPCPNDTFIFHALVHGLCGDTIQVAPELHDVEELNAAARKGTYDIVKISVAAYPAIAEDYILLRSGGALGRGVGPLVVARKETGDSTLSSGRIAIPGAMTTAALLLHQTGRFNGPVAELRFDKIMPAVRDNKADIGLVIHEGRFTYPSFGLRLVLDLGAWWEDESGMPLPLGAIAIRRSLGEQAAKDVNAGIRLSVEAAWKNAELPREWIASHAQEMKPEVIEAHIDTFVTEYSRDIGTEGEAAITRLLDTAFETQGITPPDLPFFVQP